MMLKTNTVVLNELIEKSKRAFLALPGITKVGLYGSTNTGKADNYSDLDLEVISNKPKASTMGLKSTLEKIGHSYVILPISITSTERIYTVVWKNNPFYQKMDLRLLFESPYSLTKGLLSYDERFRKFHSFFIGVIRYIKYRKRKMHWSAYKFYKASIEMWLELQTGGIGLNNYISLDKSNPAYSTKWIYPKGYVEMDKYLLDIAKYVLRDHPHDMEFGQRVIKFMRVELRV